MEITTIAAFIGFFALVLAWLAAPTDKERSVVPVIEPATAGAD